MCLVAGWNGFVGRIWPTDNRVENPDIDYEEEWYDITHHCRNPTPTLNDCESTPTTVTQSSEQEYGELRASNRHPSTPCSHNITQSFSRGTGPYTFPRSTKLVNTSLACSQDFLKVWWRVEISSVVLRPRQKSHWVSARLGMHSSWEAKQRDAAVVGSFTPVSLLWMGTINLLITRHPSKTPCHLTHTSQSNHSSFLSSPNSLSNLSQLAISSDLAAASGSLLMHSSTEAFICAKLKHPAWKTLLSSVRWGASVVKRKAACWNFLFS